MRVLMEVPGSCPARDTVSDSGQVHRHQFSKEKHAVTFPAARITNPQLRAHREWLRMEQVSVDRLRHVMDFNLVAPAMIRSMYRIITTVCRSIDADDVIIFIE